MNRFTLRCDAVRRECDGRAVDALLVTHLPNVAYLTGLHATAAALLVTRDRLVLLTDARYITCAMDLMTAGQLPAGLDLRRVCGSYDETIASILPDVSGGRVGVESEHVTVHRWNWLRTALGESVALTPIEGVVEAGRLVKDADEIEDFRAAGAMLAGCVGRVFALVRKERSEREVAAEIEIILSSAGFEDRAFPTIVASGPNSALPHARPSPRRLAAGDLVVLDFGGVYRGYCVDLSRTVCVEFVEPESRRLHAAVLEAQQAAIAAVRPGVTASSIDNVARSTLQRLDLADAFGHSTGHGLGLEVHEAPRIGRVGESGSDLRIVEGMVFTVEPGVYLPGLGGVRIEDDVLVTKNGCDVLTDAKRDLVVCGSETGSRGWPAMRP